MSKDAITAKAVPQLQYSEKKPVLILNEEGHKILSIAVDMILKKYGNDGINIYNLLIGNNIMVKDGLMIEIFDLLNKTMATTSDGKEQS